MALDEGDTTITTETALIAHEEDEDVHGTDGMPTRKSTRSRKQVEDNNFVSLFKFSCHGQRHFKAKIRVGNKKFVTNYSETCIERTPSIKRTVAEVPKFISLIYFK